MPIMVSTLHVLLVATHIEPEERAMMLPTIHLNGTSAEELFNQVLTAGHAVRDAVSALVKATPSARDYYVQGNGAFAVAIEEHGIRVEKLQSVYRELEALAIHIQDNS